DNQWRWKRVEFDEAGAIDQRGLYLYVPLESERSRVVILNSGSHGEMYFNGEPRAANVYGRNYFHVPALLNKGTNHLILRAGRREFNIRYYDPPAPVFLHTADTTLPDLLAGQTVDTWGAIVVINATSRHRCRQSGR
ncbi:MAG: hypothetical protein ACYTBS_27540, partial [Planctomycetota bacterium]